MKRIFRKHYFIGEIIRYLPRRRHLRGSWLHRLLGERLLSAELWRLRKEPVARGLALGVFVALTPTMGVQIALTLVAAFFLRVNIPVAVAACWITNPLTAPFIYTLQYKLGVWLVGAPSLEELHGYADVMKRVMRHARPLWVGSLLSGTLLSGLSYGLVRLGWRSRSALVEYPGSSLPENPEIRVPVPAGGNGKGASPLGKAVVAASAPAPSPPSSGAKPGR